jgi:hypothetical protein
MYFTFEWFNENGNENENENEAYIVLVKEEDVLGTASCPKAPERFTEAAPPGGKPAAASDRAVTSSTINVLATGPPPAQAFERHESCGRIDLLSLEQCVRFG